MSRPSFSVVAFAAIGALFACNSLNGAGDLTADLPTDAIDAPDRPFSEDGGASSSGGSSGNGSSSSSGNPNTSDGSIGPDAPPPASRIRDITFEDNALVHPVTGWDAIVGGPSVNSTNPIAGKYSMRVEADSAYGSISFAAANDLYVSLSFRLEGATSNGNMYIVRITHGGGDPIQAFVTPLRELSIVQGGTAITTFGPLGDKVAYRLELHLKSPGNVTAHLEGGGASSTTAGSGAIGASTKLEVGVLAGGGLKAMFDDVSLDRSMQP